MKKWEATDQIFVYLTLSVISAATNCSSVLLDCHARIKSMSNFMYELLEKCTKISFSKQSVLETFIRKKKDSTIVLYRSAHPLPA